MPRPRAVLTAATTLMASLASPATADFYSAVEIGYWVTAADFGGAMVEAYVVDVYLLSDDVFEGTSGSGDTLLNIYNWNTVPGAPATYFQSFTGTGWIPTNLGGPFDTAALQQADSFVTIGGFGYDALQSPGTGAGVGVDPNFGGNNAAAPGVDAGWYNGSRPNYIGGAAAVWPGTGCLIGRFSSLDGEFAASAEFLTVLLDGQFLAYAFATDGLDCQLDRVILAIDAATWAEANLDGVRTLEVYASPAVDPRYCPLSEVTVRVEYPTTTVDCNDNGNWDICDIADGVSTDFDSDGIPDECQPDCDGDGYPDAWAVREGLVPDCNANGTPDSCDIADGTSNDVEPNGVPDECKPDCNGNGLPDAYEIAVGLVDDCNENGRPDACDIAEIGEADCDDDGVLDICAVADGLVPDCNGNEVPDSCDLASGDSNDVDSDTVPDECQPDCDGDGLPDSWELATGLATDCNANGLPDNCDLADGIDEDSNGNGLPDQCDLARGDLDLDGCVGPADLGFLLSLWGFPNPPIGDLNGDGEISAGDLGLLLGNWDSGCP